jgi:hypothetical protein
VIGLSAGSRWESTAAAIAFLLAGTEALLRLFLVHRHSWREVGGVGVWFNEILISLDQAVLSSGFDRTKT